MPYIKSERRADIDSYLANPNRDSILAPQDCGELNYALTMICLRNSKSLQEKLEKVCADYLMRPPLRYQRINDVGGACAGAAAEIERRSPNRRMALVCLHGAWRTAYRDFAVAYEKTKIAENGDIVEYGDSK